VDVLQRVAEARIREAQARGELDDLPMRGRPIPLEDLSQVPADLRMAYKLLKNAGLLPEELELHKEMVTLERLLDAAGDEDEQRRLKERMNERRLRFQLLMERRRRTTASHRYAAKVRLPLGL
jgi:hypothetical protein